MLKKEDAIEVLKDVYDPEIQIDLWTLGLIYDIKVSNDNVDIKMTFTTPLCPYGPVLVEEVKAALKQKGFKEVNVEVVFDPPWEPSEDLRMMLGI